MADNEGDQDDILHNLRVNSRENAKYGGGTTQAMDNIDEVEEEDMIEAQNQEKKFREVYQSARLDGQKIQEDFDYNLRHNTNGSKRTSSIGLK